MNAYRYILILVILNLTVASSQPQKFIRTTFMHDTSSATPSSYGSQTTESVSSSTDVRVYPSISRQTEFSIANNPRNSSNLLIGANVLTEKNGFNITKTQGAYYSLDGGMVWMGSDSLAGSGNENSDPVVAFDEIGNAYFHYLHFIGTILVHPGGVTFSLPIFKPRVQKSTDGGATWGNYTEMPNAGYADKGHMVATSGRVYVAWTDFDTSSTCPDGMYGPYPIKFAYSADTGRSYTTYPSSLSGATIPNNTDAYGQGVNLAIGPQSEVYAVWSVINSGCTSNIENSLGFRKSTTGGTSWQPETTIQFVQGIRGYLDHKNPENYSIRVTSFPSMAVDKSDGMYAGRIYVVWAC